MISRAFSWKLSVLLLCLLPAAGAQAQWRLDEDASAVNFVSVKNAAVAEVHGFTSLTGAVAKDGKAQVAIALASVETMIPIRNERMREMLFQTVNFPSANLETRIDPSLVAAGGVRSLDLSVTVGLHGAEKTLSVPALLVATEPDRLQVVSLRPVIINAGDFDLEAGIEALRSIAGLKSISTAVPVSFNLVFERVD